MNLRTLLLMLTLGSGIKAYKILVFYPMPSISHQKPIMALTEKLVQEGHELFVISPNVVPGLQSKNYTYVDVSFSYKFMSDEKKDDGMNLQEQLSKWDIMKQMDGVVNIPVQQFLSEPFLQFKKRVETENLKFDLMITESFFAPLTVGMTRLFNCSAPVIAMVTISADIIVERFLGSVAHFSYVPSLFEAYTEKMSLWQKIENWYFCYHMISTLNGAMEKGARRFFRDNYGLEYETLVDRSWKDISLLMLTSNSLYYYPRLLTPNVIELGPLHIQPPKKLPKNLQDWLDGAEKGVIYFSLGSNMKSKSLPENVRSNILKFFRELPAGYRVLWKWELDGKILGQSDNILTQKWLPQDSVLAHPKVKVFVTQGGLQSFQETVHYGVPTVGIPWFGDQESIVAKMVDVEIGVRLRPQELQSYEKIKTAIETVLYDQRYSKNMKKYSAISRDFTSQSLNKGVFWVEHVAKHGGASHLRPSTADTTYFQFFCYDILTVVLVLSLIILYMIVKIFKFFISKIMSLPTDVKKTKVS